MLRSGLAGYLLAPSLTSLGAVTGAGSNWSASWGSPSSPTPPARLSDSEITLGMSAAFSGPSRGLGGMGATHDAGRLSSCGIPDGWRLC